MLIAFGGYIHILPLMCIFRLGYWWLIMFTVSSVMYRSILRSLMTMSTLKFKLGEQFRALDCGEYFLQTLVEWFAM